MAIICNQRFDISGGGFLQCTTSLDGYCAEELAFLRGDTKSDLKTINKMILNGKNRVAELLEGGVPVIRKCFELGNFKFDDDGTFHFTWDHTRNEKVQIKDVVFNAPATIVFWSDGSKTIVKATGELFDREKGLAMAIAKKFLGNKGNYFNTFKKYIK